MVSSKNLYEPNRLQNIGEIMPGLIQYAQVGDEIALGLVGDPMFPDSYRGSRPTGVIKSIENVNDETIVRADINGEIMDLPSNTIGAYNTWEFTEKGFETVKAREELKASRAEEELVKQDYRGVTENLENRLKALEEAVQKIASTQTSFRSTVVSTIKEVASEVNNLSSTQGLESKFCGTLVGKYNDLVKSRSESQFRGTKNEEFEHGSEHENSDVENDDEEKNSYISSDRARSEKLAFSGDDESLVSSEFSEDEE